MAIIRVFFFLADGDFFFSSRNAFFGGKTQALQNAPPNVEGKKKETNRQTEAKSHAIVTTR